MLWTWFEEDHILSQMGKPRIHTTEDGYFSRHYLWDLLIRRISLQYDKVLRDSTKDETVIIEFSRGKEHGGFKRAFEHLSDTILSKTVVLYVDVSYEESVRKNQSRFNPDKPDSILEHSLPADKMEKLYRHSDWDEIAERSSASPLTGTVTAKGYSIPYAVFENEDDVTTRGGEELGQRLVSTMALLHRR